MARYLSLRFLRDNLLLGGSFFCRRGHESRSDVKCLLLPGFWLAATRTIENLCYRVCKMNLTWPIAPLKSRSNILVFTAISLPCINRGSHQYPSTAIQRNAA